MNTKRTNILILILLLITIAGGAACSMGKINAQNPSRRTEPAQTNSANNTDSSKSTYEPTKRISKDVIKSDEKSKAKK